MRLAIVALALFPAAAFCETLYVKGFVDQSSIVRTMWYANDQVPVTPGSGMTFFCVPATAVGVPDDTAWSEHVGCFTLNKGSLVTRPKADTDADIATKHAAQTRAIMVAVRSRLSTLSLLKAENPNLAGLDADIAAAQSDLAALAVAASVSTPATVSTTASVSTTPGGPTQ